MDDIADTINSVNLPDLNHHFPEAPKPREGTRKKSEKREEGESVTDGTCWTLYDARVFDYNEVTDKW